MQACITHLASGQPHRSPAFRWFFTGWSITMAGSAMSPVAPTFGVLELTGSAAWLSAVLTASMVPMIATMILGGGIADRYRRDIVLRLTSSGSGISQTGVAILLLTHQPPALLLPLSAFNGIFQALTTPTMRGIVPQLASGRGIQQSNSLLASARNTTRLLGPSVAGLLTVTVGAAGRSPQTPRPSSWRPSASPGCHCPTCHPEPRVTRRCAANCGRAGATSAPGRGSGR
ncbi:MFS transporter [Streptomyces sp. NPDC005318]|uniref:MFS transporter n=1 Tax=Streptomyces sp. NPDC005318 TaxID=3157031 RepID=UPI0033AEB77F